MNRRSANGASCVDGQPMNIAARRLLGAALLRSGDARRRARCAAPGRAARRCRQLYAHAGRARLRSGSASATGRRASSIARPVRCAPVASAVRHRRQPADARRRGRAAPDDPVAAARLYPRPDRRRRQAGAALGAGPGARRAPPRSARRAAGARRHADGDEPLGRRRRAPIARAADLRFDEPTMLRLVDALDRAGQRAGARRTRWRCSCRRTRENIAARAARRALADRRAAIGTPRSRRWRGCAPRSAIATPRSSPSSAMPMPAMAMPTTGEVFRRRRLSLAPMNPAAADAYGWALLKAGDRAGARQLLEKAVDRAATCRAALAPGAGLCDLTAGSMLRCAGRRCAADQASRRTRRCVLHRPASHARVGQPSMTDPLDRIAAALDRLAPPARAAADPLRASRPMSGATTRCRAARAFRAAAARHAARDRSAEGRAARQSRSARRRPCRAGRAAVGRARHRQVGAGQKRGRARCRRRAATSR